MKSTSKNISILAYSEIQKYDIVFEKTNSNEIYAEIEPVELELAQIKPNRIEPTRSFHF